MTNGDGRGSSDPWLVVVRYLFAFAALFAVLFLAYLFLYDRYLPGYYELPHVLAPAIAIFVATATFFETGFEKRGQETRGDAVLLICLFVWLLVLICCFILTKFHGWFEHLLVLICMYGLFAFWDIVMFLLINDKEHRNEISRGSLLINVPTLLTCGVVMVYLAVMQSPSTALQSEVGYKTQKDAFVAGLVSFHIGFAAISYLLYHEGGLCISAGRRAYWVIASWFGKVPNTDSSSGSRGNG